MEGRRNVLLLGTGTQGLAMTRALKKAGCRVVLLYGERYNYADMSRYVDKKYLTSSDVETNVYREKLIQTIQTEKIEVVIPMGDQTAEFLSKNKDFLQKITCFHSPDYTNFLQGYDKNALLRLCKEKGYPHPKTLDLKDVDINNSEELKAFPYPAMLKPNMTTGGRGMRKINSYEELIDVYEALHRQYGEYHLQRFIRKGGKQVKVQLYIDENQHMIAHSVMQKMRWYPNEAGSNSCAVSIENERMVNICFQLLKDIHWIGFADFDLIEDPDTGELLIMELNPRVPACIKSAIVAGVNWGEVFVNACLHMPQKTIGYRLNTTLRHLGFEVLWFVHAKNGWKTKPNWFKFFGKRIYYQDMSDWTDPLPFVFGTYRNVKQLICHRH